MGLSQWQFSVRSGISISTLRNWEQGRNEPPLELLARLIHALGPHAEPLLERLEIKAIDNFAAERLRFRSDAERVKETGKELVAVSGKRRGKM